MATLIKTIPSSGKAIFQFASEAEARGTFACDCKAVIKSLQKWDCSIAIVRVAGQADLEITLATLELMADFKPIVQLFFADGSLPATILKVAAIKMEEESRWGIIRIRDERQVVMSSGMSGSLLSGVNIDETTQWKRPTFWNLEHLAEFNATWRQELDEEGLSAIEYRYQIRKPSTLDPWEWYRSSYRLLRGEDGLLYQIATLVDRE